MKRLHLFCFVIAAIMITLFVSMVRDTSTAEKLSRRVNALIVVDVQNCFISGNLSLSKSSAGQDGAEVVPIINDLIRTIPFDVIVYSQDWHPCNHISFFENLESRRQYLKGDKNRTIQMFDQVTYIGPKVETEQILWPTHCIQETDDAALHKNLDVLSATNKVIHIRKGIDPDIDSYSAFGGNYEAQNIELHDNLRERNVTHVFVVGLATDYCVAATALDAFDLNYTTYLVQDATRGVAIETIKSKLDYLKQRGVGIIQANQVKTLISSTIQSDRDVDKLRTVTREDEF